LAVHTSLEQRATWLLGILDSAIALATADLAVPSSLAAEDAESVIAAGLPEKRQQDLKANYESWVHRYKAGEPGERESTVGLEQIEADVKTHGIIEQLILADEPDAVVVGEEALPAAWDTWEAAGPGTVIYSVDSIDGSSPYDSLSFGFSTNLLMYVRQQDGTDVLTMTIVMNSSRLGLVYMTPNSVSPAYLDGRRDPLTEPAFSDEDVRPGFCAVVGASPNQRRLAAQILDTTLGWGLPPLSTGGKVEEDPPLTVFTLGGAPATWGIAMGKLDVFICPFKQTVHDTAGVPALLALGLKAFGPGGEPYENRELLARFNQLARPKSENYQPIPPLVIGRSEDLAALIARRLWSAGEQRLVAQSASNPGESGLRLVSGADGADAK
jgi:hypothetical protein